MSEQDVKKKIKKLLALSESDNEHEAKSALLKAKKLMAVHKMAEFDLEDDGKNVVRIKTEFTCSKRREAWMIPLSIIIAKNFCCKSYKIQPYKKQTATVCFIGFEEDVHVCEEIFRYAVDCIRSGINDLKKSSAEYSRGYCKRLCDGYGFGYTYGIEEAFETQKGQDETGWGLVMVVPQEVTNETDKMKHEKFKPAVMKQMSADGYTKEKEEGRKFNPGTKLTGSAHKSKMA